MFIGFCFDRPIELGVALTKRVAVPVQCDWSDLFGSAAAHSPSAGPHVGGVAGRRVGAVLLRGPLLAAFITALGGCIPNWKTIHDSYKLISGLTLS